MTGQHMGLKHFSPLLGAHMEVQSLGQRQGHRNKASRGTMAGGERAEWGWGGEQQLVFDLTQARYCGRVQRWLHNSLLSRAPGLLVALQPHDPSQAPLSV